MTCGWSHPLTLWARTSSSMSRSSRQMACPIVSRYVNLQRLLTDQSVFKYNHCIWSSLSIIEYIWMTVSLILTTIGQDFFVKYWVYEDDNATETNRIKDTTNPEWKHKKQYSFMPATQQVCCNQPCYLGKWWRICFTSPHWSSVPS